MMEKGRVLVKREFFIDSLGGGGVWSYFLFYTAQDCSSKHGRVTSVCGQACHAFVCRFYESRGKEVPRRSSQFQITEIMQQKRSHHQVTQATAQDN